MRAVSFTLTLASLQVLAEPSVKPYYFGEERIGFFDLTPAFFPDAPLPLPNCTWKDYTAEMNLPYEGTMHLEPIEYTRFV